MIIACYSRGNILGDKHVGGLVGANYETITDCYAMGTVSGSEGSAGGLVGLNYSGIITNCYSTGIVTGKGGGIGGLVGDNIGMSIISACYSKGNVSGNNAVGGLVGANAGDLSISNCYATGSVKGNDRVGGLMGLSMGVISACYSKGNVSGTNHVGGLVGDGLSMRVVSSFWDIETSGRLTSPGGGMGKTTAEMKTKSTFTEAGWDFVEVWGIGENQTYPFLRTEPAGDFNYDKEVNFLDLAIFASHWLEERK
jgi:hypothetical protein